MKRELKARINISLSAEADFHYFIHTFYFYLQTQILSLDPIRWCVTVDHNALDEIYNTTTWELNTWPDALLRSWANEYYNSNQCEEATAVDVLYCFF